MTRKLTCKEILEQLSAYIDEELDPSICAEIEAHMEGCNPCVAFLNTLKKTVVLYKYSAEGDEVPREVHIDLHRFLREKCAQDEGE
ncbi:anti-sigma factor family protein [Deferrisoma camini]|uniref:anti-sigma factor family protein n=1 Tax=Deferrisoma camini TaxID=1035120 RepID=UPI00046D76F4|nr:zf-HC2 domain-containing protein [Deferrisoma camini]NOY43834.1 zf-HC2 domain-containing protein [Deltaproteobacteria bacterium]